MERSSQSNAGAVRAKLEFPAWQRSFAKAYNAWANAPSDLKTPLLLQGQSLAKAESWLLAAPERLSESQKRFIVRSISQRARGPSETPITFAAGATGKRGRWRRASDRGLWSLYAVIGLGMWLFSPDMIRDVMERALQPADMYQAARAEKQRKEKSDAQLSDTDTGEAGRNGAEAKPVDLAAPLGDIDETPPIYMPASPLQTPSQRMADLAAEQLDAGKVRPALLLAIEAGETVMADAPADKETAAKAADVVARTLVVRETLGPLAARSATSRTTLFCEGATGLVAITGDGQFSAWPAGTGRPSATQPYGASTLTGASADRDCRRVLLPNEDFNVEIRQLSGGRLISELRGHEANILMSAFSPDGSLVATASQDSTARLWDAKTGRQRALLSGHDWHVVSAEFSPDGKQVVTASSDMTARLWDTSNGRLLHVLKGHQGVITSARFSEDGSRVLTISWDGRVRLWDVETARVLVELSPANGIATAQLSPDGRRIVSASADGVLRIWDAGTGAAVESLPGSGSSVRSLRFNSDGRLLVVQSWNGQVDLYDVAAAKHLRQLATPSDRVRDVEIAKGDRAVIAVTESGVRTTWPLFGTPAEAIAEGKAVAPTCLDANERALLGLESAQPQWCTALRPRGAALP